MRKHLAWSAALVAAVLVVGCRKAPEPEPVEVKPAEDAVPRDVIETSLTDLLAKPREELAAQADEMLTRIQTQEKSRRDAVAQFTLLREMRLPLAVPVWREAKFSAKRGITLPTYLGEDAYDSTLALHAARYGDLEAARKLADPADGATMSRLESYRYERNYPLEWTRLVALLLHQAQLRLAAGDVAGEAELVGLHKQLRTVLDGKAAQGPLGAALLPRGRETLARAAAAWEAGKKTERAEQARAALKEWGDAPAPTFPVVPGASRAEVNRFLRSLDQGKVLSAASRLRALDALDLPFPDESAEAVLATFDAADRLAELVITYKPRQGEYAATEPGHIALLLEDAALPAQDGTKAAGFRSRTYQANNLACEVAVLPSAVGAGAIVRVRAAKPAEKPAPLPRDFKAVHLDRSFEANRLLFAPAQHGEALTVKQPAAMDKVVNPVARSKPAQVVVQREPGQNVTARLLLQYATEEQPPPLHEVLTSLWATVGPGRIEAVSAETGNHLAWTWEDAQTRYVLRLPFESGKATEFEAGDSRGKEALAGRAKQATEFDRAERLARIKAGKPVRLLPRFIEQVELGMSESAALRALPGGSAYARQEFPGGVTVTFNDNVPDKVGTVLRQLIVRFDQAKQVAEVRGRYVEGPTARSKEDRKTDPLGEIARRFAPEELPSTWTTLWDDLPPRKVGPVLYRWRDDVTLRTYQRDADGIEVVIRDCPPEHEAGVPLPPLEYLSRGPAKCKLGMTRDELLKRWNVKQPNVVQDALVLSPRVEDPKVDYDTILVWFDKNDRATRIAARHADRPDPAKLGEAVVSAYGREARRLQVPSFGYPRRQDLTDKGARESMAWHDDRTRFRIFWQETATSPARLYTEWREVAGH